MSVPLAALVTARRSQIDDLLEIVREQLGLDAAFLGRFEADERVLRNVSSRLDLPIGAGFREPRDQTHCQRMVDGVIPSVIPDVATQPGAADVPAAVLLGVNSFVGVPVHGSDGSLYGTLCAVGFSPEPGLRDRDASVLRALSGVVSRIAEQEDIELEREVQLDLRFRQLARRGGLQIAYQPIVDTVTGVLRGHEALSRFPPDLGGNPAQWFAEAAAAGRGVDLELEAVSRALAALPHTTGYLSVNVSPPTALDPQLIAALTGLDLPRIVIELTEHEHIEDYDRVNAALAPLRAAGASLAVDDTGSGYASLGHVLALTPDIIKLDIALIRGIDGDASRQALTAAMLTFADRTGATLVAEGVETQQELACLARLGVHSVQGYVIGRPGPLRPGS